MRKRIYGALLALGMGGALVAFNPMAAEACTVGPTCQTAPLSATLVGNSLGSRVITSVTPGSFTNVSGNTGMSSPLGIVLTETAVSGDPSYQVNGSVSDFSDSATPTPHTITGHALNNSGGTLTTVVGGSGAVAEGSGSGDLGTGQTFFSSSGENSSTLYTGVYTNTSTLTLTPPNGTFVAPTGTTYTATLTVTLLS